MAIIVVSGAIANKPLSGGAAWTRIGYVLGLQKLGFDVYFVEQIRPDTCVDPQGNPARFEESVNVAFFNRVMEDFRLSGRCALIEEQTRSVAGLSYGELQEVIGSAALLVNLSGHLNIEALKRAVRRKAYIDLDPGYTQFWHDAGGTVSRLVDHDCYFTVGENVGTRDCCIPTDGIRWRPTRPPVVLDEWPVAPSLGAERFTTVASWRGPYGPVTYQGRRFGSKVHQFRKYIGLPRQAHGTFEIALDIHEGDHRDRERLCLNGWCLVDPNRVAGDPGAFRTYVQASGAEFSVAQEIYVDTRCGWFSDRTVRYLASGKPVLVEDTGFSRQYPVGEGVIAFTTLHEAIVGADRILRDYPAHAQAARRLAETYFDSNLVLGRLIDEAGVHL